MKNSIFYFLLLVTIHSNASAKDEDTSINAPTAEREKWRKAMRSTDRDWKKAKEDYQKSEADYYFKSYEFTLYDNKYIELKNKIDKLTPETTQEIPVGLNPATKASWEAKIKNKNIELTQLTNELKKISDNRTIAQNALNSVDPDKITQTLKDAAIAANTNAANNDKKNIRRGQKLLKDTNDEGASPSIVKSLNINANKDAIFKFEEKYPDEKLPVATKKQVVLENKSIPATDIAASVPVVINPVEEPVAPLESVVKAGVTDNTNTPECDKARIEIVKLLLSKGQNPKAFSDMVYLSQLKMAYRLATPKPPAQTIEAFINQNKLQSAIKDKSKDDEFKTSLTKLYDQYGKSFDIEKQNIMGEKEMDYKKVRLNNDSASALILYLSKSESNPTIPFTEQDAAAVWAQQKLINDGQFKTGSANYNLLSFNTRVCQMFKDGACSNAKGGLPFDQATIQQKYNDRKTKLENSIQSASNSVMKDHPTCFKSENCDNNTPKLGSTDIESIKNKISELVGKGSIGSDDSKVEVDTNLTTAINGDLTIYLKSK